MSTREKIAEAREYWLERSVGYNVETCGSPIEELFLWALLNDESVNRICNARLEYEAVEERGLPVGTAVVGETLSESIGTAIGLVVQQAPIGKYRCDFAVIVREAGATTLRVAIELDGHDFHERTKAQAQHDKARDRAIVAAGWQVLRFTGSEVWASAENCVSELLTFIEKAADQRSPK